LSAVNTTSAGATNGAAEASPIPYRGVDVAIFEAAVGKARCIAAANSSRADCCTQPVPPQAECKVSEFFGWRQSDFDEKIAALGLTTDLLA
jgi:hypothetical protein